MIDQQQLQKVARAKYQPVIGQFQNSEVAVLIRITHKHWRSVVVTKDGSYNWADSPSILEVVRDVVV